MTIGPAEIADLPAVRQLLIAAALPLDDLDSHVETMVIAKRDGLVVGAAALEIYADGALLRSVVVSPSAQGRGVGQLLTASALEVAKRRGITSAFLLTTTAERFFPKLGFTQISRDDVPESVRASIEFQSACPASATVMRKPL